MECPDVRTLIVYPHGLGDCILATPALRQYKRRRGDFVGFAMLERFRSSEIFAHNPYVDELIFTRDAWNDFPSFAEGCRAVESQCRESARAKGYDRVVFVRHSRDGNKILDCAEALEVDLFDPHTEVFIADRDREQAERIVAGRSHYGFVQTHTGVAAKDLPKGYGRAWLRCRRGLRHTFEVGRDFTFDQVNINVQFAIMARADAVCLPDSVFYHACGALDKPVDLAFFARGRSVYERARPLHPVRQHVVFRLEPVE